VETGANVPGYSGGLAACAVVLDPDLLSPWVADPGRGAEHLSERLLSMAWCSDSNECVRIRRLKDVAPRPIMEASTTVPSDRVTRETPSTRLFRIRRFEEGTQRPIRADSGRFARIRQRLSRIRHFEFAAIACELIEHNRFLSSGERFGERPPPHHSIPHREAAGSMGGMATGQGRRGAPQ
jgi:hypothetical protein